MTAMKCVFTNSKTLTVTEALVLRPLLEDRGCITESIRLLVPADRMKQKCFHDETSLSIEIVTTTLQIIVDCG